MPNTLLMGWPWWWRANPQKYVPEFLLTMGQATLWHKTVLLCHNVKDFPTLEEVPAVRRPPPGNRLATGAAAPHPRHCIGAGRTSARAVWPVVVVVFSGRARRRSSSVSVVPRLLWYP